MENMDENGGLSHRDKDLEQIEGIPRLFDEMMELREKLRGKAEDDPEAIKNFKLAKEKLEELMRRLRRMESIMDEEIQMFEELKRIEIKCPKCGFIYSTEDADPNYHFCVRCMFG